MNSIVITMDGMVLQRNASLTLVSITFKGSLFPEIIQCRYYLEGRARRVSSIGCSVQKTAVILIIYKTLPVLLNGIGIKIRFAHLYQALTCRWLDHHHYSSSISQGIVCHSLKLGIQGGDHGVSGIFLTHELVLHLSQKKGMGGQQGEVCL